MKTYLLILILLTLTVIPAIPAIIYNDISPDITLKATAQKPGDVYMLDIDKNSTYDFFITHFEFGGNPPYAEMNCNQHGNSEVLTDNGNIPLALSKDELINENSSVWYNSYSSTVIMSNNWKGKTDKYLGLRIKKNGQFYYGWAKLTIPLDESYVIVQEYAYQDSPGVGLKAGEIEASQPEFTLSTTTLNFGEVTINTSSEKSVTISNTGTTVVTISRLQLSGTEADYNVTQGLDGFILNPAVSKEIIVKFQPLSEGSKFAQLTFVDAQGNHVSVDMTGTGIQAELGELSLSTLSCNFGETENDGKKDTTFTLYNTGSGILTIDSIYFSGNDKEHFRIVETVFPVIISPDSNINVAVSFAPTNYGTKLANLNISYNSGMTATISLSGTSVVSAVEDKSEETLINIYPNPACDNIIISVFEMKSIINPINIYNKNGINVNDKVYFSTYNNEFMINISRLPAGLYLINYQDGKIILQEKIIIIR